MNSWKTIMLQQAKPLKSKNNNYYNYYEILDVSSRKPSVFYAGYDTREKEAYTAQQKFARRVVRLKEEG